MDKLVFHIGFHKTGTTWLQKVYFANEAVFNIINNTDTPWADELIRKIVLTPLDQFSPSDCLRMIKERSKSNVINMVSAERLSGHPISGGQDAFQIAEKLYRIDGNAKILISKRALDTFLPSVYKQMIFEGYCGSEKDFIGTKRWKQSVCPSAYFNQQNELLNAYIERFGKDNVLILDFEDFTENKLKYINKIETFLNLNLCGEIPSGQIKVNKSFPNRRYRAIRDLNRVRRTEINPHPVVNIGYRTTVILSKLLSLFYSNKDFYAHKSLSELKAQLKSD